MRNLKKLLAVIVAICVLATFTIPAFAAETTKTDAEYVSELGILKGDGNGVDAEYLAKGTTRIQAAIIYLRLLGLEDEALAFSSEDNFDDAADVKWAGGRNVLAYLKAHPEQGWLGIGGNKFGPNDPADAQMIYKVLLEGLGYKQGTDFEYADVIKFAAEKGLTKIAAVEGQITNDNLATALVEALGKTVKDGSKTLAQKLGLVKETTATAAATGAKKLAVTFSQAVDTTKATISVKKGTIAVNLDKIEWSEDKTVATLNTTTNLTKGDYTITVKGVNEADIVLTVSAEDERVAEIKLDSDKAPRNANSGPNAAKATVSYKVLNQYGEALRNKTVKWTTTSTWNGDDSTGKITLTSNSDFIPGTIVYLTGVYNSGANVVTISTKVEIVMASQEDKVEFKGVYNVEDSKFVDLPAGFDAGKYLLLFEVKDQYGNKLDNPDISKISFVSNNPLFVKSEFSAGADKTIDDVVYKSVELLPGDLAANGGSVEIMAISTLTGTKSTYSINADALSAVKTFTISAPSDIIAEGEDIEIPFTAEDQYGKPVTNFDSLNNGVTLYPEYTVANGGLKFEKQSDGSAKLKFYAKGTNATANNDAFIYLNTVVKNGASVSNVMINVKAAAVPVAIVGLDSDVATNIAVNNIKEIDYSKFRVQDQYGRIMKDEKFKDWIDDPANSISVTSTADGAILINTTKANLEANPPVDDQNVTLAGSGDKLFIKAVANTASNEVLAFKLMGFKKDDGTTDTAAEDASAKSITFTKTAQSAYKSYEIEDLGKMYNDGIPGTATPAEYNKTVKVNGILADGTKVELPASDYVVTLGAGAKLAVSGNVISDLGSSGYDKDANPNPFKDNADVKVTVLVTVNDNTGTGAALAILEKELLVSNEAPKIAEAAFDGDKVTDNKAIVDFTTPGGIISNGDLLALIKNDNVKDQYGVDFSKTAANKTINIVVTNLVKTSGSSLSVENNATPSTSIKNAKMGDKFTVTYKYDSGLKLTVDITVGKEK